MRRQTICGCVAAVLLYHLLAGSLAAQVPAKWGGAGENSGKPRSSASAAVSSFFNLIAEGRIDEAKLLYIGDRSDLQLLDSWGQAVAASNRLRVTVNTRFGTENDSKMPWLVEETRSQVRLALIEPLYLDGDFACIQGRGLLGFGVQLRRLEDRWWIVSLGLSPSESVRRLRLFNQTTLKEEELHRGIATGVYKTAEDIRNIWIEYYDRQIRTQTATEAKPSVVAAALPVALSTPATRPSVTQSVR